MNMLRIRSQGMNWKWRRTLQTVYNQGKRIDYNLGCLADGYSMNFLRRVILCKQVDVYNETQHCYCFKVFPRASKNYSMYGSMLKTGSFRFKDRTANDYPVMHIWMIVYQANNIGPSGSWSHSYSINKIYISALSWSLLHLLLPSFDTIHRGKSRR